MNIKKQLRNLYLYEIISGFQIADSVWVLFFLGRGFSLVQAGLAESFFHVVSMCCEIPSGMLSDMIGRRKTLILSGIVSAMGSFCMIASDCFGVILIAMGLNAFSYNLVSGTREALTYDSLLEVGQEHRYLKIASAQENIYLGILALTNLFSVITVSLGYRTVYLIAVVQGILCSAVAVRLSEAKTERNEQNVKKKEGNKRLSLSDIRGEFVSYAAQSMETLQKNPAVCRNMLVGGLLASGCYVLSMFMQKHLVLCGLDAGWIGIPQLCISLFAIAGAALGGKMEHTNLKKLMFSGSILTGGFIAAGSSSVLIFSVFAAGLAHGMEEILMLRIENENQQVFSSEIRATMVSVNSMVYSIFMVLLSPVVGWAAREFSTQSAFLGLGFFIVCMGGILSLTGIGQNKRDCGQGKIKGRNKR